MRNDFENCRETISTKKNTTNLKMFKQYTDYICSFLKRKEILYYDSYHAENLNILEKIFTSLDLENVAAFGVELYRPDWKLNCVMNTPLQRNGVDCGCHALIIAENISRRCLNFDFQTKEINSYREKIAYEIIAGNLFEQKLCADF